MQQQLRVALLGADSDVRFGRRMVISSVSNFSIVLDGEGEASEVEKVAEGLVDVLVIDQRLATGPGVLFYSMLRDAVGIKQVPGCVVTTAFNQPALSVAALELGVESVVSIEQGPEALLEAIELAAAGKSQLSLANLYPLVSAQSRALEVDLNLVRLVDGLPEKLASNLRRLRTIWMRANLNQLEAFSLESLVGLVARLPVRTPAELVLRLERSGLLGER